jgi:succinate dehydrogenase/fumarate reductase-like Fe-S protein
MKLTLKIWRQANAKAEGKIVEYPVDGIEEDMSFLEMLDVLNEGLINKEIFQYLLTTIVAKEFAVLARCTSTVRPRSRQTRTYLSVAHENVQGWRYHFY